MKRVVLCLLLFACGWSHGRSYRAYAPCRGAQALMIVRVTSNDAGVDVVLEKTVDLGFPAATIVSHPKRPLLYVAAAFGDEGHTPGAVITLDEKGRYLRHQPVTLHHGYSYLSLDRTGRFLLGVTYRTGHVDVYRLDQDGRPGERTAALDEGRTAAHAILPSPDNRFVYIPYVKDSNALLQYRFDEKTGALTALDPPNAMPPAGTGPRHIAYHPTLPIVYFSNEQHIGVSAYDITASGALRLRQVCDAIPDDKPREGISSSDIVVTSDGRYAFAGIRSKLREFNRVSRYRIKDDGTLALLGLTRADEIPWGFTLSPDGKHLLVTAAKGHTLTVFAIEADGNLTPLHRLPWDGKVTDIVTR